MTGPTGKPDFDQNPPSNPTSQLWDMGEAANHELMGGGGQSRSGRWYWASGFETGAAKDVQLIGASTVVGNSAGVWQGLYALYAVTQAIANDGAGFTKQFISQNSPAGRWGIEAMIAFGNYNTNFEIFMDTASPTDTHHAAFRIKLDVVPGNLVFQYLDSSNVYQTISTPNGGVNQQGANFAVSLQVFHNIKFVVDFSANKYVRIIIDGVSYDLSSFPTNPGAAGSSVAQGLEMLYTTLGAVAQTAIIDNVVFTADEP